MIDLQKLYDTMTTEEYGLDCIVAFQKLITMCGDDTTIMFDDEYLDYKYMLCSKNNVLFVFSIRYGYFLSVEKFVVLNNELQRNAVPVTVYFDEVFNLVINNQEKASNI